MKWLLNFEYENIVLLYSVFDFLLDLIRLYAFVQETGWYFHILLFFSSQFNSSIFVKQTLIESIE